MFDIQGNKIILKTDELAIPPFKDYYNNAKDKSKAIQDIEFVIWRYRWNTPYEAYPEKNVHIGLQKMFLKTNIMNQQRR